MKLANIILSVITLALSVYVFYVSNQFPEVLNEVPGPGIWPRALSVCLFGVSLFLLFTTIFSGKKAETNQGSEQKEEHPFLAKRTLRVYIMMGVALVYLVIMMLVGFIISTALFIVVIMLFMGEKKIWLVIVIGTGSSLGLYFLFYNVFRVLLPAGLLFY